MRILYRILDWCERNHADVFLQQMWGNVDWNAFPEFHDDPVKRAHSGPRSMDDFAAVMEQLGPGTLLTFEIQRGQQPMKFDVTLGTRPAAKSPAPSTSELAK